MGLQAHQQRKAAVVPANAGQAATSARLAERLRIRYTIPSGFKYTCKQHPYFEPLNIIIHTRPALGYYSGRTICDAGTMHRKVRQPVGSSLLLAPSKPATLSHSQPRTTCCLFPKGIPVAQVEIKSRLETPKATNLCVQKAAPTPGHQDAGTLMEGLLFSAYYKHASLVAVSASESSLHRGGIAQF